MATKTSQRITIWVIAAVMLIGTLGAYFVVVVASQNEQDQLAEQQKQYEELQKQLQCNAVAVPEGKTFSKPAAQTFDAGSVSELKKEDVVVGTGQEVTAVDQCVTVHYLGNTPDGKVFDNSYDRGEPTAFRLDGVIPGWQEGMQGMKVGGARKLYIPSGKAYGEEGNPSGGIPANTPLYFYVELVGISS